MTESEAPERIQELRVVEGLDRPLIAAFVLVPMVVGPAIAFALTMGFDPVTYVTITALVSVMTRSAIWHLRASGLAEPRATLYRERRDASANMSFLGGIVIGLAIYDIVPLPSGPLWTAQQPRASFTLLAIIVYLVWASQYARIPVEVRDGWKRLLGR